MCKAYSYGRLHGRYETIYYLFTLILKFTRACLFEKLEQFDKVIIFTIFYCVVYCLL